jgi:hypothetical protein
MDSRDKFSGQSKFALDVVNRVIQRQIPTKEDSRSRGKIQTAPCHAGLSAGDAADSRTSGHHESMA